MTSRPYRGPEKLCYLGCGATVYKGYDEWDHEEYCCPVAREDRAKRAIEHEENELLKDLLGGQL